MKYVTRNHCFASPSPTIIVGRLLKASHSDDDGMMMLGHLKLSRLTTLTTSLKGPASNREYLCHRSL